MNEMLPTLQALEDLVKRNLREIEAAQALLTRSLQQIRAYATHVQTRTCPFCGGRMVDLKPLHEVAVGDLSGTPIDYYLPRYRYDWECQACWVCRRDHEKPFAFIGATEERWDRASLPRRNTAPAKLFKKYPRLKIIVKYSRGNDRYWYLATDDGGWYYFEGPAQKLLAWLPEVD